jgi:2-keto-4-pentenoate hydratase/2-oxohepta-3-ene-1,7-dioic acid hydratase in catechol pathway
MIRPSKIVCVGRNYRAHAAEMGNDVPKQPMLFLKPPSSIIREGDAIKLHKISTHIEFEGEIGLVIGHTITNVNEADAMKALSGIIALNDVTARDLQKSDGQWARAKGMDTFLPLGKPAPVPDDLDNITLVTRVNGEEKQRALASDMVFPIPMLLSYISKFLTLEAGDIVATGTPAGTRQLHPGDVVEVELVGLSRVTNPCVAGD